ncbi:MAG: hypothetical protein PUH52_09530 [Faecalibacterium sp.]|nr:hypothetical protein [Faecalibacterium prausnitzii]MDD7171332.1 hypothetical protein [Faecalibacterium sp.]MDY5504171.1 hypothetical protein [Faecalibacterium sp.]
MSFHDVPLFTEVFFLYLTIDSRLCNRIFLQKAVENPCRTRGADDLKCPPLTLWASSAENIFEFGMQKRLRAFLHPVFTGRDAKATGICRTGFRQKHPRGGEIFYLFMM